MIFTKTTMPRGTRPVAGFPGFYITRYGTVWTRWSKGTKSTPRRLTRKYRRVHPTLSKGYLVVQFHGRNQFVHVLVALAFIGPRPAGKLCRHLDGDRANPKWTNLAWGTPLENSNDIDRHGTRNPVRGEKHPHAKLNDRVAKGVIEDYGHLVADFIGKRAKQLKVKPTTLVQVLRGVTWSHLRVRREIIIKAA